MPSWRLLGAACLVGGLGACAGEPPLAIDPPAQRAPSPDGGVRAIDAARGLGAPEYGQRGSNTGTWGGQQLPNLSTAPRL
jgi:hypothetical protein